jgi:manganese/iron transport system substrate-binding protein
MSRPATALLAVLGVLSLIAGCDRSSAVDRGLPKAVATISILADFVRAVGGDHVRVDSIVHVGGDPHVYEPTPSDARRLAEANIVFRNGLGLERWLDKLIGDSRPDRPVVTLTEGLAPLVQDSGIYAGDPDPHMWMDPRLARRYVERARDALIRLDPGHAATFEANARVYLERLAELDRWIAEHIATLPPASRKLVTTHDAFRYFGGRYELQVVGTIWSISTEREPSAAEIRHLVDAVRRHGVPAVFVETTINPKIMQQVARDAGVKVGPPLYGDSVGPPGSDAETYLGMMRSNTRAIVGALGGTATE